MKEKLKTIGFFIIITFFAICCVAIRWECENQRIDKRIELRESK
jgi:hypothetical protein